MPIGTGIVYNTGDLILSQVSSSGTAFLETKIAAATSSLIYFDSTARINSASLNSITVGTSSYVSGSTSIITNLTASNISASGTSSFGYVGIGTNSPIYKLDVQPTSSTARIGQSLVGAFPANPSVFSFFGHSSLDNVNTAANYAVLQSSTGDSFLNASSGRNIYFRLGNTDKMILNSSGQFGIGTTSPIAGFLDVRSIVTKSVAGPTNIAFFGSSDGGNPLGLVVNHESSSGVKMVGLVGTEYGLSGNNIKINETLHVQYSGNVGIGTTIPGNRLEVAGSTFNRATFKATANVQTGIQIIRTGGVSNTDWEIYSPPSSGDLRIYNGSDYVTFQSGSGSVGIGTTSPNSKLEVAGTAGTAVVSVTNSGNGRSGSFGIDGNGVFIRNSNDGDYFDLKNASGVARFRVIYDNATHLTTNFVSIGNLSATGSKLSVFGNTSIGSTYGSTAAPTNGLIVEGNVGIGTTVPGAKLEISASSNSALLNIKSPSSSTILYISGSGAVGVGTSAYTEIGGNGYLMLKNVLCFVSDNTANSNNRNWSIGTNGQFNGDLYFVTSAGSSSFPNDAYRISFTRTGDIITNGSIGVGTTVPVNKLQVNGNVSGSSFTSSISNAVGFLGTSSWAQNVVSASYATTAQTANALNTANSYTITNLTASNISASLTGSFGIVGIGSTSPGAKLDVVGDLRVKSSGAAIILDTTTASDGRMEYKYNGTRKALIGVDSDNLQISADSGNYLQFRTNDSQRMIINNAGGVGIGTSNPNYAFDVYTNGSADALMSIRASGSANARIYFDAANGDLTGGDYCHLGQDKSTLNFVINTGGSAGNIHLQPKEGTNNGILFVSGSTRFGLVSTQNHQFTGSVNISGSLNATASWAQNVVSASYALTSSFATRAQTANALNALNTYSIAGLTSAYVDVDGSSAPTTGIYRPSTKTLGLSADGTLIFKISNVSSPATSSIETGNFLVSGSVGIGTTSPGAKLQVAGNISGSSFTSSISNAVGFLGTSSWAQNVVSASFATTAQTANALNTGNSYTVGSLTSTTQIGGTTGTIQSLVTPGIYSNGLSTGNAIAITSNTTFANQGAWANLGLHQTTANANDLTAKVYLAVGGWYQNSGTGLPVYIGGGYTSNSSSVLSVVPSDTAGTGNVGIGTTSPSFKLDVSGSGANARIGNAEIGQWPAATAYTYFGHEALDHSVGGNYAVVQSSAGETFINSAAGQVMHFSVGNSEKVQINSSGNVGINTQGAAITSKLMISGSGSDSLLLIRSPISGAILYVSGSGAVGIGTSNVGAFTLQVSGSFGATTKSFIIDHPTKAGKKLMYGSLESPYHGIRLTGRDTLKEGKCKIELPDYIYKLILHDSVNIQLTGIKCNKTLYIDDINVPENHFTIAYDKAIFESYKDYEFFWDFTAIRADVPELQTEM